MPGCRFSIDNYKTVIYYFVCNRAGEFVRAVLRELPDHDEF
jgi:hypothetical protein